MFGLGMSEIILLGIIALVVIGPKELPQLARTIGRFLNELKRSTNGLTEELREQARFNPEAYRNTIPNPNKGKQTSENSTQDGQQLELTAENVAGSNDIENKKS